MKKVLCIIITLSIISCKQKKESIDSINYYEFYSALNELIKSEFPNVKMIVDETMPVYRMYGQAPITETKEDEPPPPPPPPPPPGLICYSRSTFHSLVFMNQLDSSDANFMYESIDSTRKILIDPLRLNLRVIEQKKIKEIFNHKTEFFPDRWKEFRKTFGQGCFIETSTPIFNWNFTKMIITIQKNCGPPDNEEYIFILGKSNDKWIVVKSEYDVTTDPS